MCRKSYSRRDFLRAGSLAMAFAGTSLLRSPRELLARTLIQNAFNMANAQVSLNSMARNYVNVQMAGGPLRYAFDHWLRASVSDPTLMFNSTTGTSFTYNSTSRVVTGTEYRTFDHKGFQIPQVFAGLSAADREAFLNSFLVIRGYGSNVDGHPNNSVAQLQPLAGLVSLSGLVADQSSRSYKAIQAPSRGQNSKFVSANSVGLNVLASADPLGDLLAPLTASTATRVVRTTYDSAFTQLRSALSLSNLETQTSKLARASLEDASKLLKSNFADYETEFASIQAAYETVITTAMRSTPIPGVNSTLDGTQSLQLISDGSGHYLVDGNPSFHTFAAGVDLVPTTSQMVIANLSTYFALAEYVLANDLSSSVEISAEGPSGILTAPGGSATVRLVHDCHQLGDMAGVFFYSHYYLGLLAALLKFRERLISHGKWSSTVVHLTSDFNRSVKASGLGSDHGFNQMVSSVFSGAISGGPYLVGNIARQSGGFSQGQAAAIASYSNSMPTPISMASTLHPLLGVEKNPWINLAAPLVLLNSNGTLQLPYGVGKVIA